MFTSVVSCILALSDILYYKDRSILTISVTAYFISLINIINIFSFILKSVDKNIYKLCQ